MSYSEMPIHEISQTQLMADAKHSLSGRWALAVGTFFGAYLITEIGVYFVYRLLSIIVTLSLLGSMVTILFVLLTMIFIRALVGGPFALGIATFALRLARDQEAEFGNIFDGFRRFGTALGAYLFMNIAIFLGTIFCIIPFFVFGFQTFNESNFIFLLLLGILLFVVPGVIISIGLSQTMYILADEPELGALDALKESWQMMDGHKLDYFVLILRFIPWAILCFFTLGIGLLWLAPYWRVTFANFYDALRYAQDLDSHYEEDDISRHLVEE